jgi:phosphoenolpyruvate carboxylase
VPKFLRRVDTALKNIGIEERLPHNVPLIQFSSWMGGDRDGMLYFLENTLKFLFIFILDSDLIELLSST